MQTVLPLIRIRFQGCSLAADDYASPRQVSCLYEGMAERGAWSFFPEGVKMLSPRPRSRKLPSSTKHPEINAVFPRAGLMMWFGCPANGYDIY
jgi:hypothetical protein